MHGDILRLCGGAGDQGLQLGAPCDGAFAKEETEAGSGFPGQILGEVRIRKSLRQDASFSIKCEVEGGGTLNISKGPFGTGHVDGGRGVHISAQPVDSISDVRLGCHHGIHELTHNRAVKRVVCWREGQPWCLSSEQHPLWPW